MLLVKRLTFKGIDWRIEVSFLNTRKKRKRKVYQNIYVKRREKPNRNGKTKLRRWVAGKRAAFLTSPSQISNSDKTNL